MLGTIILALVIGGIVGFIGLLMLIMYYFSKDRKYWPSKGVQNAGFDIVGNPIRNLTKPMTLIDLDTKLNNHCKKENINYIGGHQFSTPYFYCKDLELIKRICVKDFDHFVNRRKLPVENSDPHFAKMLFTMEGDNWKEMRSKMSPTFTTGKIRRMFEIFDKSSRRLVEYISEGIATSDSGNLDLTDGYGRYTMDVIASAAFGVDSKTFEETDSIFNRMGQRMRFTISLKLIMKVLCLITLPKVANLLGFSLSDKEADTFFTRVITSSIRHRERTGEKRDDFLQLMLEARDGQLDKVGESEMDTFEKNAVLHVLEEKSKAKLLLDDDAIIAQSILFFQAGFDTTQSLLIFSAYQLALCPEIQEKLAAEVISTWEDGNEKFTYDSINQMQYLDKFINETLRMYPPAARTERRCHQNYRIPDTDIVLEKDTLIFMPVYAIHHDADNYRDPENFDPERFSSENKAKRNLYAFMPFGHGPRNCIGMRFALMEVKVALSHFVRSFVVEPGEKTIIPIKFAKDATTKPKGGMWLTVKTRN